MLAVDFSVYHHACLATRSTTEFPEVNSQILSSTPHEGTKVSVVMSARSDDQQELGRYLEFCAGLSAVKEFEVLERQQGAALFRLFMVPRGRTVTRIVLDNGAIFSTPISVSNGLERWSILLLQEKNRKALVSALEDVGVVRIERVKQVQKGEMLSGSSSLLASLTSKQLTVLRLAAAHGYFDLPRRAGSRQIAPLAGMAQSTFLEHLRKAQSRIIRKALENP